MSRDVGVSSGKTVTTGQVGGDSGRGKEGGGGEEGEGGSGVNHGEEVEVEVFG